MVKYTSYKYESNNNCENIIFKYIINLKVMINTYEKVTDYSLHTLLLIHLLR